MKSQDTVFSNKNFINCRGKLLDLSIPRVMGILNVTENSFYDGGKFLTEKEIITQVDKMLLEGADIIDIGVVSTKPKSEAPVLAEEIKKLRETVSLVRRKFPEIIISADTYRSAAALAAIEAGADIINDIGGGTLDPKMFETISEIQVPYILMHIQGTPYDMQDNPTYESVLKEVLDYFIQKCSSLKLLGIKDIIIDPGFGFGKTNAHNFTLLKHLEDFKILGCPILAGLSRKSMINKVLKTSPEKALNGTTVLNTIALLNGANILRVHDVKEARETVDLAQFYLKSQ